MNAYRKLRDILQTDRTLMVMLCGIVISGIGFVSIIITAGLWFL
jgi:hypothetical protein